MIDYLFANYESLMEQNIIRMRNQIKNKKRGHI